jgi:c-di-GMP-binding flagellar brake protein YcgR
MGIILKKSARRDQRVSAKAICWARHVGAGQSLTVQMNDLSLGGMSFYANQPGFKVKNEIEILIKDSNSRLFVIPGRIVAVERGQKKAYRHSVEFRHRLTENQLTNLLQLLPIDHFVKSA